MLPSLIPGGLLIVIEGIDGAGKTTLAEGLNEFLLEKGARVSMSKEPTRGPWGMKLRESAQLGRLTPDDERRFLLLDRKQHVDEVIKPALRRGEVVILDRYVPSMVAYQGAAGLDVNELIDANSFAPKPDLLLLLDLGPEVGLSRIRARGDEPNHFETSDNLSRCRAIFLEFEARNKRVIDATQSADEVKTAAQLWVLVTLADRFAQAKGISAEAVEDVMSYMPSLAL